jgi:hypothetical protein
VVAEGHQAEHDEVDREEARRWVSAMRRCPRCGERKPPGEFYARQDRPGRDRPHCRDCHKAIALLWQRENRERKNEANRRYRARHRDEDRERSRRGYARRKAEREAMREAGA